MPALRTPAHTRRAIPPVALGNEWTLLGLGGGMVRPCFAVCSPGAAMLAQKIKLLAHDNKLRADCLLNLPAVQLASLQLAQMVPRQFQRFEKSVRWARAFAQDSIVSDKSNKTFSELRIAQAYELLCLPNGSSKASVTLAQIGNYEIRIFAGPRAGSDGMPLFWLELFDHRAKRSVDSFSCYRIDDAVVVFDDFILQAGHLNDGSLPDDAGTQD
jgi:hypothetical protein